MTDYNTIKFDVEGPIATLTLHRPERLNAFTVEMQNEMIDAFDRIDADDAVRAVIVTGAGRGFCAGADLSGLGASQATRAETPADVAGLAPRDGGGLLTLRIFKCLKPVIAAINGAAVGVGATMTLAMDVRLASTEARIGFVFLRRGLVPEAASSWFLPRLVGISKALEWCYTGQVYPAAEMHEAGLIRSLHAPEDLHPAARALALSFAEATAPVSIALARQMLWHGLGWAHPMEAHKVDSRGIAARKPSADVAEGINSFLEKRPAQFADKVSTDMPDFFPWWDEPNYL